MPTAELRTSSATLVANAIARPDEPRHFMVIEPLRGTATARIGHTVLASSERALLVKEVGRRIYDPVVYFPPSDVRGDLLTPIAKRTTCPLKGNASYYETESEGSDLEVAWSYQDVFDFDPRLAQLGSCVAFHPATVSIEIFRSEEQ